MVVQNSIQPLSAEALINRIATNQSKAMFLLENYEPEQTIRDANAPGLAAALLMNPPIYASDFAGRLLINLNISKVLTENLIVLIVTEEDAKQTWKNCESKSRPVTYASPDTGHLSIILFCLFVTQYL
jgi:hypothetical protein